MGQIHSTRLHVVPVPPKRVFLLYCLSGFVSLGYQVVWFRLYADRFGSTNLTFVVVLCSFVAGLGFGALASRSVCRLVEHRFHLADGLRCYGALETLISVGVCLTLIAGFLPSGLWSTFPYTLTDGVYRPGLAYQSTRVAIATVCVFTPSFLMGVTFPALCRVFHQHKRFPSALYACNTLGACVGVVICHFVLLPLVGHSQTLALLIGLNLLIGGYFLIGTVARVTAGSETPSQDELSRGNHPMRTTIDARTLVILGALGGLLTGAVEGDLFKRMWFYGASSGSAMVFISFWSILAIFLASATITRLPAIRLTHLKVTMTLALLIYAVSTHFAYQIRDLFLDRYRAGLPQHLSGLVEDVPVAVLGDPYFAFAYVGLFTFPVIYLLALLLPHACNAAQGDKRALDLTYGANTLAFCLGMVAFTWAVPRVDIFFSLKLIMVVLAAGAGLGWLLPRRGRFGFRRLAIPAVVLAAGIAMTPPGFDRTLLNPALSAYHYPVRALKSNGAHTTYVVARPSGDTLYFDSHPMSGTNRASQIYMRLMAHVPLLAQPAPRSALLIGFGVGNTAAAIATHSTLRRIDVVDLNEKVIETAPEFAATNARVYEDARIRFFHDDGRSFLRTTTERYDLITSEPPPPIQDGVFRLYSREYYQDALARLTERGMLSQWLPIGQLSAESIDLMVGTFVDVFPHAMLFSGHERQLILVGARSPIDLARLEQNFFADPLVVADLEKLGIAEPVTLLSRLIQLTNGLHRDFEHTATISDQRNDLAYLRADPFGPARLRYAPGALLDELAPMGLTSYPMLESVLQQPERVHYRVPDFPFMWLRVETDKPPTDWRRLKIRLSEFEQTEPNATRERIARLEQMLASSPRHPALLLMQAKLQMRDDEYMAALETLQRFQSIEPDEIAGAAGIGAAYVGLGKVEDALRVIGEALMDHHDSTVLLMAQAKVLQTAEQPLEALVAYDRVLALEPDHMSGLRAKAELLEQLRDATRSDK